MEINYVIGKLLQFIQIPQVHNSKIDKTSKIRFRCQVVGCNIGKHTYISENSIVLYCEIGSFTSIAGNCHIGGASHPTEWASTSPVFQDCKSVLKEKLYRMEYNPYKYTKIGNDVWIGCNSMIKSGVTIGDGAVIGMGSVVTHDVGAYEIWAGNPAKMIKKRFTDNTIEQLERIKWWQKPDDEIARVGCKINNIDQFIKEFNK